MSNEIKRKDPLYIKKEWCLCKMIFIIFNIIDTSLYWYLLLLPDCTRKGPVHVWLYVGYDKLPVEICYFHRTASLYGISWKMEC